MGGLALIVIRLLIMQVLASLSKTTEGRTSTWRFCQDGDSFFALRIAPALKVLPANHRKDLRQLYDKYVSYGFAAETI